MFVGRQAELDLVSNAWDAALASRPQIVSIEGEAGIGKTAFLRRILAGATAAIALEASGDESEVALPYGVVSQLVSRTRDPGDGSLSDPLVDPSSASAFSVGAELLGMLGSLQDRAPVVVAVDDAHMMDLSSAGALLFALRRLYADRVLVLLASRPEELDRLGPSWRRLLDDSSRVQTVRLGGLSTHEVSALASSLGFGSLTQAAAARLREHTSGHPLYVSALLGELSPQALTFDGPLPAPHSFAATVLARLASVSDAGQDLVTAAAVAGSRCPLNVAGSVAGVGDPLAALEDAIAAGLLALVPARLPEEVTFPHPLIRAAIYDDLPPSRRRALHLACAELTSGSASLPHRVAASRGEDDPLAEELIATGEQEIAAGALTAGADQLLWGSRIAATREVRESALLRAAECLVLAGELPRALSLRDEVLACAGGPHKRYVVALLTVAVGRLQEAEAALTEAISELEPEIHRDLFGRVSSSLAIVCALLGRADDAIAWAHRALEWEGSPATTRVIAIEGLAVGLATRGRVREAIELLGSLSPARIRPEPFEAELLVVRGNLKAWWGDLPGALRDLTAVIRWSRDGAPLRSLPNAYAVLADVEYRTGRWDDGLTHAEVAVSLGEDADRAWDLPLVHAVAGYFHAARGNWRFAAQHVELADRAAAIAPIPLGRYYARIAAAQFAWARQDWDAVLDSVAPLHSPPGVIGMTGSGERVPWLLEAEAMIRTGRLQAARAVVSELGRAIEESDDDDVGRVDLWRLRGALEHARGRPAKARAAFLAGRTAANAADSPFAAAKLELAYGHFLHKQGSRRTAIVALRAARDGFDRLGAHPFAERCEAELAACGVRARRHRGDDPYGLTAREQVVSRLVASGKSNREVAAELYVSSKAVEYHLANIFTKVGIHSRHQLASALTAPPSPVTSPSSDPTLASLP